MRRYNQNEMFSRHHGQQLGSTPAETSRATMSQPRLEYHSEMQPQSMRPSSSLGVVRNDESYSRKLYQGTGMGRDTGVGTYQGTGMGRDTGAGTYQGTGMGRDTGAGTYQGTGMGRDTGAGTYQGTGMGRDTGAGTYQGTGMGRDTGAGTYQGTGMGRDTGAGTYQGTGMGRDTGVGTYQGTGMGRDTSQVYQNVDVHGTDNGSAQRERNQLNKQMRGFHHENSVVGDLTSGTNRKQNCALNESGRSQTDGFHRNDRFRHSNRELMEYRDNGNPHRICESMNGHMAGGVVDQSRDGIERSNGRLGGHCRVMDRGSSACNCSQCRRSPSQNLGQRSLGQDLSQRSPGHRNRLYEYSGDGEMASSVIMDLHGHDRQLDGRHGSYINEHDVDKSRDGPQTDRRHGSYINEHDVDKSRDGPQTDRRHGSYINEHDVDKSRDGPQTDRRHGSYINEHDVDKSRDGPQTDRRHGSYINEHDVDRNITARNYDNRWTNNAIRESDRDEQQTDRRHGSYVNERDVDQSSDQTFSDAHNYGNRWTKNATRESGRFVGRSNVVTGCHERDPYSGVQERDGYVDRGVINREDSGVQERDGYVDRGVINREDNMYEDNCMECNTDRAGNSSQSRMHQNGRHGAQPGQNGRHGAQPGQNGRRGAQPGQNGHRGAQPGQNGRHGAQPGQNGRHGTQPGQNGRHGAEQGISCSDTVQGNAGWRQNDVNQTRRKNGATPIYHEDVGQSQHAARGTSLDEAGTSVVETGTSLDEAGTSVDEAGTSVDEAGTGSSVVEAGERNDDAEDDTFESASMVSEGRKVVSLYSWIIKPVAGTRCICVEGKTKERNLRRSVYMGLVSGTRCKCVEGKTNQSAEVFWHSGVITRRVTEKVVESSSKSLYKLMGNLELLDAMSAGISRATAEAFWLGFPPDWERLLEQHFRRCSIDGSQKMENSDNENDISIIDLGEEELETAAPGIISRVVAHPTRSADTRAAPGIISRVVAHPTGSVDTRYVDEMRWDELDGQQRIASDNSRMRDRSDGQERIASDNSRMRDRSDGQERIASDNSRMRDRSDGQQQIASDNSRMRDNLREDWCAGDGNQANDARDERARQPMDDGVETKVIYGWIIKPLPNNTGVQVQGIRNGKLWTSSAIEDRIYPKTLMSITGAKYRLKGHMDQLLAVNAGLPEVIIARFRSGFPKDWQELVREHLYTTTISTRVKKQSGSQQKREKRSGQSDRKKKAEKKVSGSQTHEMSESTHVFTPSGEKVDLKSLTHSRSGRLIRPPLLWWAGQHIVQQTDGGYTSESRSKAASQYINNFNQEYEKVTTMHRKVWKFARKDDGSTTSTAEHRSVKVRRDGKTTEQQRRSDKTVVQSKHPDKTVVQSKYPDKTVVQSKHSDKSMAQSRHPDKTATKSKYLDKTVTQSKRSDKTVTQSKYLDKAVSQSNRLKETTGHSEHLDKTGGISRQSGEAWTDYDGKTASLSASRHGPSENIGNEQTCVSRLSKTDENSRCSENETARKNRSSKAVALTSNKGSRSKRKSGAIDGSDSEESEIDENFRVTEMERPKRSSKAAALTSNKGSRSKKSVTGPIDGGVSEESEIDEDFRVTEMARQKRSSKDAAINSSKGSRFKRKSVTGAIDGGIIEESTTHGNSRLEVKEPAEQNQMGPDISHDKRTSSRSKRKDIGSAMHDNVSEVSDSGENSQSRGKETVRQKRSSKAAALTSNKGSTSKRKRGAIDGSDSEESEIDENFRVTEMARQKRSSKDAAINSNKGSRSKRKRGAIDGSDSGESDIGEDSQMKETARQKRSSKAAARKSSRGSRSTGKSNFCAIDGNTSEELAIDENCQARQTRQNENSRSGVTETTRQNENSRSGVTETTRQNENSRSGLTETARQNQSRTKAGAFSSSDYKRSTQKYVRNAVDDHVSGRTEEDGVADFLPNLEVEVLDVLKKAKSQKTAAKSAVPVNRLAGGVGTLKRRRALREMLEQHNENHEDDLLDTTPFRSTKHVQLDLGGTNDDSLFAELARKQGKSGFQTPVGDGAARYNTALPFVSEKKTPAFSQAAVDIHRCTDEAYIHNVGRRMRANKRQKLQHGEPSKPLKRRSSNPLHSRLFSEYLQEAKAPNVSQQTDDESDVDNYWDN